MIDNYDFRTLYPGIIPYRTYFVLILVMGLLLFSTACTRYVPREDLPYPLTNESFDRQVKVVMVPLPVIATSPNEGTTFGVLNAFLLHNRKDEVSTLIAPQVNHNKNFGTTFSLYGALYPEPGHSWEANVSKSQNVNEDYEVRFIDRHFLQTTFEMNTFPYYFTDGSARFFGFQSTSLKENETNYGDQECGVTIIAEYLLTGYWYVLLGERLRKVNIVEGAVAGVPFIRDKFTPEQVPGITGFTTHAQKIGLEYKTLDSPTFPVRGSYARFAVEFSSEELGSDDNYRHYEVELKKYLPFDDDNRFVTVLRTAYNQTLGDNVPFLERSILGGETTLRGYGRNRFIDSSYLLINVEERIRLFRWKVFNVNADWEIAPFLDVGTVTRALFRTRAKNLEYNPGIGFRAVVRPNIVGRVDLGFGSEGVAVFVGLGYPF